MFEVENLRLSKDMKYTALYWALGYEEIEEDIFIKKYNNFDIIIDAINQYVDFPSRISIVNSKKLNLNRHKSFVILECIDKLLKMGYSPQDIIIDMDNEYDIYLKGIYIKCFEWGKIVEDRVTIKNNNFISIMYSSRLISGIIERISKIKVSDDIVYDYGFFESDKKDKYNFYNLERIYSDNDDFIIIGDILKKYKGKEKKVIIPSGIKSISSCAFWDNQYIEEVELSDTVINLGGDTFYNCNNLKKFIITKNVENLGNNPFAGCPKIDLENESSNFNLIDGVLFSKNNQALIYYPINNIRNEYIIPEGTKIIGKHAFYKCNNLEKVTIPSSVIKMENNPFAGCEKLMLDNQSEHYKLINNVIYNKYLTSVVGCLNSIEIDCLYLINVKTINRNSFWNCKGIRKIILPESLENIGYNPFVGCTNISFVSKTPNYIVSNGVLYNRDQTKLICYPSILAIGEVSIPDATIEFERGAFSGCDKMTSINLHNVSIISKTCFTNCNLLEKVYCSDLVSYIGEWAFAHCDNLKEISVHEDCYIDNNVISNSNSAYINIRNSRTNYIIESENYYTLKSLLNNYKNKIDSILIDPPYNSNIDYIGYKDGNYEGGYRSFIKQRIEISFDLLSEKGFLIINIDKGEANNISNICKKIFGKNSVSTHKWKKLHKHFDINRDTSNKKKKVIFEYIIICKKNSKMKYNYIMQPYVEEGIIKESLSQLPQIFDCFGTTSSAKDEIKDMFGSRNYFSTPKPVKLLKELIRATTSKDSIILDYFAGSGTTGHACLELNKEDAGNRKFILVSNNENNICKNVTLNRLKRLTSDFVFLD